MKAGISLYRSFLIILALALVFLSYLYINASYAELVDWYLSCGKTFYRVEFWATQFFTAEVKAQGDTWAYLALFVSLGLPVLAWHFKPHALRFNFTSVHSEEVLIFVGGLVLGLISGFQTHQAFDEVFSAVNFAEMHPFQTLSYYVLPNNHVFFNLLNGICFSWAGHLVESGRLISILAYSLVLVFSWRLLRFFIENKLLQIALLGSLAFQFQTWGFAGQARGYELVLFMSVWSFYHFLNYWMYNRKRSLFPLCFALVLGMFTLLSFLYWFCGLSLAALSIMYSRKKIDWLFIKGILLATCSVFLLYSPLLLFSGLHALTDNQYMKALAANSWEYIPVFFSQGDHYRHLFTEWFCFDILSRLPGYFLILLPALFYWKKTRQEDFKLLAKIYFSMLLAYVLVCIIMKNMAYTRNMIAQGYLVWFMLLVLLSTAIKPKKFQNGWAGFLFVITAFTAYYSFRFTAYGLYYYNVDDKLNSLKACRFDIPKASTIFLDNESFYWQYVLKQNYPGHQFQISSNTKNFKQQDFIIALDADVINLDTAAYRRLQTCSEFAVFKKKERP